jgi:hypothetical protein
MYRKGIKNVLETLCLPTSAPVIEVQEKKTEEKDGLIEKEK